MFSGAIAEPLRAFPPHERHFSDHYRPYAPPARALADLPRPLEPRPTHLQSSPSEPPAIQRQPDAFRTPAPIQPEHRPQGQNLPRLQDILTSAPPAPSPSSYSGGWTPTAVPPANPPSGDGYYSHAGWHPPMVHPPLETASSYQPQPGRRLELPILETSPVARHDSHSVPRSPFSSHFDGQREYNGYRQEKAPQSATNTSYLHNGGPVPYTPAGAEETQYRSPASLSERPPSNSFAPASTDSSKKYMGVRDVPGEGSFHFYEGGYRIPTHVDGETVNPAWGLTKANKPRKRLAMACLDCREKKIKCEPGPVSCLQCEKAKRPCRKAPLHQIPPEHSATPVWQSGAGSPGRSRLSDSSIPVSFETESDMANKRRTVEDASPSSIPTKKHRSASPVFGMNGDQISSTDIRHQQASPVTPHSPDKVLSGEEDPYALEPIMTPYLLDNYFSHVNNAAFGIFPPQDFIQWVTRQPRKSPNEQSLLYAMLAMGSIFADDRCTAFGKHCANMATEAVHSRTGHFSMALVQTQLILGHYHFAKGSNSTGWDYIGAAINAATFLKYHTEHGCGNEERLVESGGYEFGLSRDQLVECKRRTMWSAFLMERYCGVPHTIINPQDVFIRLPCSDDVYERGLKSNAPYHNNGIIDPAQATVNASSEISPMAWVVLVATIWGDVNTFIHRAMHYAPSTYEEEYQKFYDRTCTALHIWAAQLPEHLHFTPANLERSIQGRYDGPFISMHVLYYMSLLRMTRFVQHRYITKLIPRNIQACHRYAQGILQITSALRNIKRDDSEPSSQRNPFACIPPFAGYAILGAIDVVGAGGLDTRMKSTLDLISDGNACLRDLAPFWSTAQEQNKACEKRFYQIQNVAQHPLTARSGCWLGRKWGIHTSLELEFGLENDCIYGVSDQDYFDAVQDDTLPIPPPSTTTATATVTTTLATTNGRALHNTNGSARMP